MNILVVALMTIALSGALPSSGNETETESSPTVSEARGFTLEDPTQHSLFRIGLLGWIRASTTDTASLSIPVARTYMMGRFRDGETNISAQVEFAGDTSVLLDLELLQRISDTMTLNIGKYRPHFSRGWRTGLPALALHGRGLVQDTFHPDRAIGATILGSPTQGRFDYSLGVFVESLNASLGPTPPTLATLRLAWSPRGVVPYTQTPWFEDVDALKLTIGANAMIRRSQTFADDGEHLVGDTTLTASCDLAIMNQSWVLTTETFIRQQRTDTNTEDYGAYAIVSKLLPTYRPLDITVRVGLLDSSDQSPIKHAYELGVGFYPTHTQRLKASLSTALTKQNRIATHSLSAQLQLWL